MTHADAAGVARRLGALGVWTALDALPGGSDRLVDDLVAWGDAAAIRARIRAHHDAGADHVCIQPFRPDGGQGPHLETLEELAPKPRAERPR